MACEMAKKSNVSSSFDYKFSASYKTAILTTLLWKKMRILKIDMKSLASNGGFPSDIRPANIEIESRTT